ncbi:MAG: hypothetical protein ACYC8T_12765 [Myxococcaceae bacterium]
MTAELVPVLVSGAVLFAWLGAFPSRPARDEAPRAPRTAARVEPDRRARRHAERRAVANLIR